MAEAFQGHDDVIWNIGNLLRGHRNAGEGKGKSWQCSGR
jgi:hypothetical protein